MLARPLAAQGGRRKRKFAASPISERPALEAPAKALATDFDAVPDSSADCPAKRHSFNDGGMPDEKPGRLLDVR